MGSDELSEIKETLNEIKKILGQHEIRISELENRRKSTNEIEMKELSIKEFFLQKKPKSDPEKTLLVGYFLEHYRGASAFNSRDLTEAFREAKEKFPSNISRTINDLIKRGYVMETKDKKEGLKSWTLTSSGERFVENELGK